MSALTYVIAIWVEIIRYHVSTLSKETAYVIAGVIPTEILIEERRTLYQQCKKTPQDEKETKVK